MQRIRPSISLLASWLTIGRNKQSFVIKSFSSSPEVESGRHGLVGDADVQTIKVILWVTVGGAFVQVTVPLDQDADRAALENTV